MSKNMITPILIILSIITYLQSCDTTEPKIEENIFLQELDVAVTEAYLHISFESAKTRELALFRNGERVTDFICTQKDTVIADTALTQITNYKYKIKEYENSSVISESNIINLTTLAPTNHNIIWETHYFEEQISGTFWDVAIVNENNIWTVGEVYLPDSLGERDNQPYAAAHWEGNTWKMYKISYRSTSNPEIPAYPGPLFAIYALDENNIYSSSYANLLKYEDGQWRRKAFFWENTSFNGQVRKIWTENNDNIYCSGNNGAIYHVTNTGWQKIVSNTEYVIFDLWGYQNPITTKTEIICSASDQYEIDLSQLLKITDDTNVESINLNTKRTVVSAWTKSGAPIYICGDGIFSNKSGVWKEEDFGTNYFTNDVRGNALNDIFVIGDFGLIAHYNGIDWMVYNSRFTGGYTSLSVKENIIAISGNKDGKAIVTIGKRI